MKNKILKVKGAMYERLLITDDMLHLFIDQYKSKEEVETQVSKGAKVSGIRSIPLASIKTIEFNEGSEKFVIQYENKDFVLKKQKINFDKVEHSNIIGNFLGEDLGLKKETKDENRIPKLLGNAAFCLLTIGALVYFFNETSFYSFIQEETSSSRSGRKTKFLQVVLGMIGHKPTLGILALAGCISGYNAFNEFKSPAQVISYKRV